MAQTVKRFQVVEGPLEFEFEEAEEGGYIVTVPDLPGCVSEGDTFEDALGMIKDALKGYLLVARDYGDPIPERYRSMLTQLLAE